MSQTPLGIAGLPKELSKGVPAVIPGVPAVIPGVPAGVPAVIPGVPVGVPTGIPGIPGIPGVPGVPGVPTGFAELLTPENLKMLPKKMVFEDTPARFGNSPIIIIWLAQIIVALLIIFVIGLIVYWIYLMIFYYYPRPFAIGHTEPLEQFMDDYIPDIVTTMHKVGINLPPWLPKPNEQVTVENASYLYLYFALGKDFTDKSVLQIADKLVDCSIARKIAEQVQADYHSYDALSNEHVRNIAQIKTLLEDARQRVNSVQLLSKHPSTLTETDSYFGDASKHLDMIKLSIMLDSKNYIKPIQQMYDFRKSGGFNNTTLLKITLTDYVEYVWGTKKGIIPRIWKNYVKEIKAKATLITNWLGSKQVRSFMTKLPAKIGGVEKFSILPPPGAEPDDVIEEFGFLKGLLQIPKFFIALFDVAKAIAKAFANPLAAIRILIGMIIGTVLFITYIIVYTLSTFLSYIPAFFFVTAILLAKSAQWVSLFVIVTVFYIVLFIIDGITGGLVFKFMRCENIPNAWFSRPNYMFGNKYFRGIFCNFTCASRFLPSADGDWCERMNRGRPEYCPQQIVYQVSQKILSKRDTKINPSNMTYRFTLTPDYYTLDEEIKKDRIVTYLYERSNYISNCHKNSNSRHQIYTGSACEYLHALKISNHPFYKDSKSLIEGALKACVDSHCYSYLKLNGINKNNYSFCPIDKQEPEEVEEESNDGKTIAQRVIYTAIVIAILGYAFVSLYWGARDESFDFNRFFRPGQ